MSTSGRGQAGPPEPHEGIDPFHNQEAETEQTEQSPQIARGGMSGTVTPGSAPGPEDPGHDSPGGTKDADPIAGVGT